MKRFILDYLVEWKSFPNRKPLIIRGARQVGKTFIVREFAKNYFDQLIEINFDEHPEYKELFNTKDTELIIQNIEIALNTVVNERSLLFFDEIQAFPEAIKTLRYFYEKKPNLHIISAGSLLDYALNDYKYSMPVGRVEFAYMFPLNFKEFLIALDEERLYDFIQSYQLSTEINPLIHKKLLEYLRVYYIVGGMPEAVDVYSKTKSILNVKRIHESIIKSFEYDFSKNGSKKQQQIMIELLRYIPKSIGNKFKYVNFDSQLRSKEIKECLQLLEFSRLIHSIKSSSATTHPLESEANKNFFKLLFVDIGMLNHILKISLIDINNVLLNNEGSLAEQFVGQELIAAKPKYQDSNLFYWVREKTNSEAEIDYLEIFNNKILPIEVKSGKTGSLKSLHVYISEKKLNMGLRFNIDFPSIGEVETTQNINKKRVNITYKLISLPLYLSSEAERIINNYHD